MSTTLRQPRILVVDDESANRTILATQLDFAGYKNIVTVENGQQALDAIANHLPDLVLLDVMMPGMDGYEVTAHIRKTYPNLFIPVVLLSALQEPKNRIKGIEAGANDFLSRPFNPEELMARINSLLALKQVRDELAAERENLGILYSVSRQLATELDTHRLLGQIIELTTNLTQSAKTSIVLVDASGNFLEKFTAKRGEHASQAARIEQRVLDKGLYGWIIQQRKSVLISDVTQDSRWTQLPEDADTGAAAAVPLLRGNQIVGVLLLTSQEVGAFGDIDFDLLLAIGNQAAIALENARLLEESRRQRTRIEALLSQTANPVIVTDCEGCIQSFNPAAAELLQLTPEVEGKLLGEQFGIPLEDLWLRAHERGSAISGVYSIKTLDPETSNIINFNVSISPIEEVGYLLVWQDISALKENERVRMDIERAERAKVMQAFSRYMGPTLVERVLNDPNILHRRERREAVVLFADLRNFTQVTVLNPADVVVEMLNDIYKKMLEIVHHYEGVLFDIVGDELMVAYNVPYDQDNASQRALQTAIDMLRVFEGVRRKWATRGIDVGMGIGINRGTVVLGHIGSPEQGSYSMVGEAVNIGHRLVELAADRQIVVMANIVNDMPDDPDLKVTSISQQRLKGKKEPQQVLVIELQASAK